MYFGENALHPPNSTHSIVQKHVNGLVTRVFIVVWMAPHEQRVSDLSISGTRKHLKERGKSIDRVPVR